MPDAPSNGSPDFPNYFGIQPSQQNALDLFKGEWSTRLPDKFELMASTGPARHCEDYRVDWAADQLGTFAGKSIVELGPMEAGHAYMLEQMNAARVVAIEANARAYLKCLVVKEIFSLTKTRFLLGDFTEFLANTSETFDVGFACGVLYHHTNPVALIELLSKRCKSVFVWTVFHDAEFLKDAPDIASYFNDGEPATVSGFKHTLYRKKYGKAVEWKGFCGGNKDASWMSSSDILGAFEYFGFSIRAKIVEKNPNGPALLFVAEKR